MSRAFVKEDDDAPPPPPPERRISAAPNRVTPRGARLIGDAIAVIQKRLASGPAGDEAVTLRRDLRYWQSRQAGMQVMTPNPTPQTVGFGVRVTIRRGSVTRDITIVGEDEADPSSGLIAWTAPLARALMDAGAGDIVDFEAGGGVEPILVAAIAPGEE
jgi:transcription elongation GreA/GreB family factor